MKRGKKYLASAAKRTHSEQVSLEQAVGQVKSMAFAKFDETVEVAIRLNLKSKHTVRDTLVLPHGFRAEKKILVFAKGDKAEEARANGAAYVGDQELIEKIQGGWLDFDIAVATPDMMKDVGKLGQMLGRRGMMPNPKTKTVTFDVMGAVEELRKGRVEFKADKSGVVHMAVGKVSMDAEKILDNARLLLQEVLRKRPADLKGEYIRSIALSSTMGPGVLVNPKEKFEGSK
jgi:large subunit ribosomal protein L1